MRKREIYKRAAAFVLGAMMLSGNLTGMKVTDAAEPDYIFDGNMIINSSFDAKEGWEFLEGGYASNNGHQGKGDNHFYLDNGGRISQQVRAPYTGYYKTGLWVAAAGKGGKYGISNLTTGEEKACEIASNTTYTNYNLEIWMNKGDIAEVWVTRDGKNWVNGDDISVEYNRSRFENMVVNPEFDTDRAWEKSGNVQIADGKAVLSETSDGVSQKLYIPLDGAYYAEVELENADGAVVSFAGETSAAAEGSQTIKVEAGNLMTADETELKITGKAEVERATVKFDLDKLPNTAPTASEVAVNGDCTAELILEGNYKFEDADGHAEGDSLYRWLIADEKEGEYQQIENENGKNIVVKPEWEDKYLKFEVTPADQYAKAGTAVQSDAIGPVELNIIANPSFESNGENWSGIKIKNSGAYDGINKGYVSKNGTVTQKITVPRTAYYDFTAYTQYNGTENGRLCVEDEAGNTIAETNVQKSDNWTANEISGIPLEKGQSINLVLKGAKDADYDVDKLSLKRDREAGVPAFKNVISFKTNPKTVETVIDRDAKTIELKYMYGTDISNVTIEEFVISDGARADIGAGERIDLSAKRTFTLTGNDGSEDVWKLQTEIKEKKVMLESSNEYLQDTFNWAANKMDQFVMTGKTGPINVSNNNYEGAEQAEYIPSYWAGYYDRTAFYTRDFVHQATGGQIAGLAEENYSMFEAFAKECTEARKWYTVWALNFDGSIYNVDYKNDNRFVREVPAQFELVEKAYKQYLWSGDERYIQDETLWDFYTNVMTKYVDSHDANGNGVVQEVGTGIFNGSCTYNERGRQVIEAGDAIGSQYQATLAYAGMLKARGNVQESETWYQKAADLRAYFNDEWSMADSMESGYVCAWGPNGEKYSDFSKETSWFMPMKLITEPGERNDAYIDFILASLGNGIGDPNVDTEPNNIEAYTYIPDMLFPYNRSEDAWKWMKYITSIKDEPHERPVQGTNGDYPEISFTFVSHTVEGMMGVEPNAGENFVATSPRLPGEVPDVTAKYMQIGDYELDLTHIGNEASELTNNGDKEINWEARFYGSHDYIQVNEKIVKAEQKEINGETVSYTTVTVPAGEKAHAAAVSKQDAEDVQAALDVDAKIDAIGQVTLESKPAIDEARAAYEALNENAKTYVTKRNVLEAAEEKYARLLQGYEEMVKEAENVERLINDLGEITLESKEAVARARAAYDALSEEAKALVTNVDILETAEAKIEQLEKEQSTKGDGEKKPDKDSGHTTVKTGDRAEVSKNLIVLAGSLAGIAAVVFWKKKDARNRNVKQIQ